MRWLHQTCCTQLAAVSATLATQPAETAWLMPAVHKAEGACVPCCAYQVPVNSNGAPACVGRAGLPAAAPHQAGFLSASR